MSATNDTTGNTAGNPAGNTTGNTAESHPGEGIQSLRNTIRDVKPIYVAGTCTDAYHLSHPLGFRFWLGMLLCAAVSVLRWGLDPETWMDVGFVEPTPEQVDRLNSHLAQVTAHFAELAELLDEIIDTLPSRVASPYELARFHKTRRLAINIRPVFATVAGDDPQPFDAETAAELWRFLAGTSRLNAEPPAEPPAAPQG